MSIIDDIVDVFRTFLPYYFTILVSLFIIISPINPVKAAQDFTAYRLQQYDIQGIKLGSRSSIINLEAQVLQNKIRGRKCILFKLMEASAASIKFAISQNIGAVILLIPLKNDWNESIREHLYHLELELLNDEFHIPIYFTYETENVKNIFNSVSKLSDSDGSSSAASVMINSIWSHGYQLYTSYHDNKALSDIPLHNLFGKLAGNGIEEQLPTILLVAHYDSFGMAPSLSYGYDSNGSGVTMLIQIMRLFSKYYSILKSHGKYNLAFLLTAGGKLNYIGTKKWLDDINEQQEGPISPDKISMVICLDSVGSADNLYMHVSRPPKNNSIGYKIQKTLENLINAEIIHKKINLNDDHLHWEHERFSLRKIAAFTLSSRQNNSNQNTILDDKLNMTTLTNNIRIVVETLVRLVYNIDINQNSYLSSSNWIDDESVASDFGLITRYPRSAQLLAKPNHPLLNTIESIFKHNLQSVKRYPVKADPRDPEFILYSATDSIIVAHKVKPAIFDFLITCLVLLYLGAVFLIINNFSIVSKLVLKLSTTSNKEKFKKII